MIVAFALYWGYLQAKRMHIEHVERVQEHFKGMTITRSVITGKWIDAAEHGHGSLAYRDLATGLTDTLSMEHLHRVFVELNVTDTITKAANTFCLTKGSAFPVAVCSAPDRAQP